MPPPPAQPAAIAGYDFSPPTEADALAALQRVFGAERGEECWVQACRDTGLSMGEVDAFGRMDGVARALAAQGGPTAAIARSLEIRMRTYRWLAERAAATSERSQG